MSDSGLQCNKHNTDMECNIRIDRLPLGRVVRTLGQSAYLDIALHISNYYINIAFPRTRNDM